MNAPVLYQNPTPRNLSALPGFRRDGKWRRKYESKAHGGRPAGSELHPEWSLSNLMGWVLALRKRRGAGEAWNATQQAAIDELNMRAWRPCDIERRKTIRRPSYFVRKYVKKRYWDFLALLVDAFREGAAGVMCSFSELAPLCGVSRSTMIRHRNRLEKEGLISVVRTCVEASKEGRRRDDAANLYQLGPRAFMLWGDAPLEHAAGLSEGAKRKAAKDAARARGVANRFRASEREALQATQRASDLPPKGVAPEGAGSFPEGAQRPSEGRPKKSPAPVPPSPSNTGKPPHRGSVKMTPQPPPPKRGTGGTLNPTRSIPARETKTNLSPADGRCAPSGKEPAPSGAGICNNLRTNVEYTAKLGEDGRRFLEILTGEPQRDSERGPIRLELPSVLPEGRRKIARGEPVTAEHLRTYVAPPDTYEQTAPLDPYAAQRKQATPAAKAERKAAKRAALLASDPPPWGAAAVPTYEERTQAERRHEREQIERTREHEERARLEAWAVARGLEPSPAVLEPEPEPRPRTFAGWRERMAGAFKFVRTSVCTECDGAKYQAGAYGLDTSRPCPACKGTGGSPL